MCIYRKEFAFKPVINQLNILVGWNLSFTESLNTSYFDNGWIILRILNTIKDFATSFPFLTLNAVNLLLWKKILSHSFQNHYSNQTKHSPTGVLHGGGGQDLQLREVLRRSLHTHVQNYEPQSSVGYDPHQKVESSLFPSCLTPSLSLIADRILQKISLIALRQMLPKLLPVAAIFSFIITSYLQKFIEIKYLNTKQCPAELSPWIIPLVSPHLNKTLLL